MKSATFNGQTTTYSYDVNGNREAIEYDGGVREEYTYDKNNRIQTLTNRKSDGTVLSSYQYTYDAAGRWISKTDDFGTTFYTYDEVGRIINVEAPGKTTVYAYDNAGNRKSMQVTYTSEQSSGYIEPTSGENLKEK
ncbi:hypothetical protein [Chengkuizengella axinellae]